MKFLKRLFIGLLLLIALAILLLYIFDYDYLLKGIKTTYLTGHNSAYIDDYPNFDNRIVDAGDSTQVWPLSLDYNEVEATDKLKKINEELGTVAYLIIKNDSIWYEYYSDGYGIHSKTNSFSMAKSIVVSLLGKAIEEGYIKSLKQPVADFFPKLDTLLTVGDLASMSSGLNWNENYYSPFAPMARAYFDKNIGKQILNLKVVETPGQHYKYLSCNTQLLSMVIKKATGKTISEYLSESFWIPMGMNQNALWQLDSKKNGLEKAYCCIASNARNFAKFGKLYEHYGKWNGVQLLDSSFIAKAIHPRFEDAPWYGYGFWLTTFKNKQVFYMRGFLGQYVIVIPKDKLIIVRLGQNGDIEMEGTHHPKDFYEFLEEAYKMVTEK